MKPGHVNMSSYAMHRLGHMSAFVQGKGQGASAWVSYFSMEWGLLFFFCFFLFVWFFVLFFFFIL